MGSETRTDPIVIEFTIQGRPRSWKRPRMNRRTGQVYTAKQDAAWRRSIWGQSYPHRPEKPLTGPIALKLLFRLPIPRSWPLWKQERAQAMAVCGFHWAALRRPDLSNLLKAVEDALEGPFYEDDRQVVVVGCARVYASVAGVDVRIEELGAVPETREELTDLDAFLEAANEG